ncbi:hypothetical protein SAY87_007185 [Trapa incisa]|uniref:Leucine-rich repeat-containing N-terminal plant-type domain-containing protein n=1 Tax=Trapa incisa TaxID=236973 RepID=A0AAN7K3Y2_9MYRT|nr:hypothetical protein SAY87_007185 [Trapa incisa]
MDVTQQKTVKILFFCWIFLSQLREELSRSDRVILACFIMMVRARVPPTLLLLPLLLLVLVHSLFDLDPLVVIIDVDASSSFSSFSQPQVVRCHEDERSALLGFKRDFSFTSKSNHSCLGSWDDDDDGPSASPTDCCSWDGIECDVQNGHVIGLDLSNCLLEHPNPLSSSSSLFRLTYLQKLNLARNNFSYSPIPPAIGSLVRLKVLDLSWSSFGGQVPQEITRLSYLSTLYLFYNHRLELKKPDLEDLALSLTKLEELHLDEVDISAPFPDRISNLSSLRSLKLADCNLQGRFPTSLLKLPSLQVLDVGGNRNLSSSSLETCGSLRELYMSNCNFSGRIPVSLILRSNCTKLSVLDLSGNMLHGQITPYFFENLSTLTRLELHDNQLSGEIPSSIGNLSQLRILDLSHNQLAGSIPSSIINISLLRDLDLNDNQLTGSIPGFFPSGLLQYLGLSNNQLTGTIPTSPMGLSHLWLSYNELSGPISSSICNFTRLEELDLEFNQLTGPIPSFLLNLAGLEMLYLGSNQLTGPIPSTLGNSTVQILGLDSNELAGPISSSLGNLSQLVVLDLGSNQLIGSIPSFLGNLVRLVTLNLHSNQLTGPMSPSLGSLRDLKQLYLSFNQLSGPIPSSLGNLNGLSILDLSSNQLTGPIPSNLTVMFLDLSSNQLTGSIPSYLGNITQLYSLDLSHNQLTGIIPDQIPASLLNLSNNRLAGHIPNSLVIGVFEVLDLRSNELHGSLPVPPTFMEAYYISNNRLTGAISPLICNMSLIVLDLAENNFSGSIPGCLSNMSSSGLQILNLRGNKFSGGLFDFHEGKCELTMMDVSRNQLQGRLPRTLVYCTSLEYLNVESNLIDDKFPSWLSSLSNLSVLILRSNGFHGEVLRLNKGEDCGFPQLHIIDLSQNNFSGPLPFGNLNCWKIVRVSNRGHTDYLGHTYQVGNGFDRENFFSMAIYDYSMTIINKGTNLVYPKIFPDFIAMNLSSNNFSGEIPSSVRFLQGLHLLNLSHNVLTGHIPRTLSNITQLEVLDLSYNNLSGTIRYRFSGLLQRFIQPALRINPSRKAI